jgi:hypothetical protein
LKSWNNHISNKDYDRLNNYSIYLMLIAYMQSEKILPNLQARASINQKMGINSVLVSSSPNLFSTVIDTINYQYESLEQLALRFS